MNLAVFDEQNPIATITGYNIMKSAVSYKRRSDCKGTGSSWLLDLKTRPKRFIPCLLVEIS